MSECPRHQGGSCSCVEVLSPFPVLVIVHALAATVWTAERIRDFEAIFEPLGLTAWTCRPGCA